MTIREMWRAFRARRREIDSSAEVRLLGSCLPSRSENPASKGEEIWSLVDGMMTD